MPETAREALGLIACTTVDVLGFGCVCESNGWDHEWTPAPASTNGLHWCANCDCCVAHMEEDDLA